MSSLNFANHFNRYFRVILADTPQMQEIAYKIRYDVYAKELNYETNCPIDKERDEFDAYAKHALIQSKTTGIFAGCVRLIIPPKEKPLCALPFEKYCQESVQAIHLHKLNRYGRLGIGEISRLAVLSTFRRRSGEIQSPYGINVNLALSQYSQDEMRIFPLIAVALYLCSMAIALENHLGHVVVMMEPRLARLLNRYGICFEQIGDLMEYHGQRALFCLDKRDLLNKLKPELIEFYKRVKDDLYLQ